MRTFLSDFKKFLLRGNLLDLAVAVVVGVAFNAVVQSFANDVLMALIGALFGKPNFNDVVWGVADGDIYIGKFITAVVNFIIVAFAVFMAIKAFETMSRLRRAPLEDEADPLTPDQELLTEIRDLLREQRSA
jgi:large conductance mechanosensitive channel